MARFDNYTLTTWAKPLNNSEDEIVDNVVSMVRDAIKENIALKYKDIEVFVQGSYKNNTNVRQNSDVDINVCLKSTFYYHLPIGKKKEDFGITPATIEYPDYKDTVCNALLKKFGQDNVKRKNKCIHIKENTYHHEADVVPTFEYREYNNFGVNYTGVKFVCDDGITIVNYPKQQIENGIKKNNETGKRYKFTARILKRIRYIMLDEGVPCNKSITSFLIESLSWNVPNELYEQDDLNTRLKDILCYLFGKTTGDNSMQTWNEESGLLPLFSTDRKWDVDDVREFVLQVYRYLGYADE